MLRRARERECGKVLLGESCEGSLVEIAACEATLLDFMMWRRACCTSFICVRFVTHDREIAVREAHPTDCPSKVSALAWSFREVGSFLLCDEIADAVRV